MQAVQKFLSEEPDELGLEESDIVNVLRKTQDGWSYKRTTVKLNQTKTFIHIFGHLTASSNMSLIQALYLIYIYFGVNY